MVLVLGQGVLYGAQIGDGVRLVAAPADAAVVDHLAIILIILFALGLARAWEFAGADNPSLLSALVRVTGRAHHDEAPDQPADDPAHEIIRSSPPSGPPSPARTGRRRAGANPVTAGASHPFAVFAGVPDARPERRRGGTLPGPPLLKS